MCTTKVGVGLNLLHEDGTHSTHFTVDLVPTLVLNGGLTKMKVRQLIMSYLTEEKVPGWYNYMLKHMTEDGTLLNEFECEDLEQIQVLIKLINYDRDIILKPVLNEFITKALENPQAKKAVSYTHLTLPTNREV